MAVLFLITHVLLASYHHSSLFPCIASSLRDLQDRIFYSFINHQTLSWNTNLTLYGIVIS